MAATTTRKVLTVHAPLQEVLALGLLNDIEESLKMRGAQRVWIATDSLPDLVIMAEVPEEGS